MMYDGTKDSLKNIVEWLEGTNNDGWRDQRELAEECVSDLRRMSRPIYRPDKTGSLDAEPPIDNPFAENLERAIPHAQALVRALERRDRSAALNSGRAAFAAM